MTGSGLQVFAPRASSPLRVADVRACKNRSHLFEPDVVKPYVRARGHPIKGDANWIHACNFHRRGKSTTTGAYQERPRFPRPVAWLLTVAISAWSNTSQDPIGRFDELLQS